MKPYITIQSGADQSPYKIKVVQGSWTVEAIQPGEIRRTVTGMGVKAVGAGFDRIHLTAKVNEVPPDATYATLSRIMDTWGKALGDANILTIVDFREASYIGAIVPGTLSYTNAIPVMDDPNSFFYVPMVLEIFTAGTGPPQ